MNARTQFQLNAQDLEVVLALARTGTLASAGERLVIDGSTVFRSIQRIERGLGAPLFERSRAGYLANDLAKSLLEHAERMESALEAARSASQSRPGLASGNVRISTTDTVLHGLVAPALKSLRTQHPMLNYELHTGNELASLTRRDADIAVRATKRPPQHLVGRHIGPIRMALYVSKRGRLKRHADVDLDKADWIAPDDALPDHPSVVWRKRRFPAVTPCYRVTSILSVMELIAMGMGVGALPLFLAQDRSDLVSISEVIDECQTELWLLTHPESRHLRRVSVVYGHLADALSLP